jgi:hypothetical protein
MWYEEPGKDGPPDEDNRYTRKASRKPRIEISRTSYGLEARGNSKRPSGGQRDWKSQSNLPNLMFNFKEVNTGRCGGVDPLRNEKMKQRR